MELKELKQSTKWNPDCPSLASVTEPSVAAVTHDAMRNREAVGAFWNHSQQGQNKEQMILSGIYIKSIVFY